MGRRKREMAQMGKALIKDRFRGRQTKRNQSDGFLHTTDLNDDDEYAGNIMSVTDQNSLDDFLTTAELAGRDFTAQRENVQLVTAKTNSGVLSPEQLKQVKAVQEQHKNLLRIPRRPAWSETTTAEKLQHDENLSFLEWRRQLGQLQENEHIHITPYEKNLEFWRQLWRVIERSDVVMQIVDARNPLLFYCQDLEEYVKEVDPLKQSMLLVNKADLLSEMQRQAWAEYFTSKGIKAVFWSAANEIERVEAENKEHFRSADNVNESDNDSAEEVDEDEPEADVTEKENDIGSEDDKNENQNATVGNLDSLAEGDVDDVKDEKAVIRADDVVAQDLNSQGKDCSSTADRAGSGNRDTNLCRNSGSEDKDVVADSKTEPEEEEYDSEDFETEEEYTDDEGDEGDEEEHKAESHTESGAAKIGEPATEAAHLVEHNKEEVSNVLRRGDELLELFRKAARKKYTEGVTTVGMVGYPNVGKSSTINAILKSKKVPVSATPGRTKHFQTLYVENDLMLCDCPGLVFPSFVNSKADLVVNGILPIDQLQDSDSPVALVCDRVGRETLQATYSINLPPPEEWEDPAKPPSAYHLLQAYGSLRGFMTHKGNVDRPRAARLILKDYVNGRVLFCHSPPGIDEKAFQKSPYVEPRVLEMPHHLKTLKTETEQKQEALDREFYAQSKSKAHNQGPHANKTEKQQFEACEKPWKKHHNKNKREKLRRVYADLDKH